MRGRGRTRCASRHLRTFDPRRRVQTERPTGKRSRWGVRGFRAGSGRRLPHLPSRPMPRGRCLAHAACAALLHVLPVLLAVLTLSRLALDLDALRALPLLRDRDRHFEDAVVEAGLDLILIDALGQRNAAIERTVAPLA